MNNNLIKNLLDYLREYDSQYACPSYESLREKWQGEFEDCLESEIPWDEFEVSSSQRSSHVNFINDIFGMFVGLAKSKTWSELTLEDRQEHVKRVTAYPQIPQRTKEWYAQSKGVLTASEFATILGTPRAMMALALQKVAPIPEAIMSNRLACSTPEMGPFDWGIRFEPVVKQILNKLWGVDILEIGRLVHKTNTMLAASPDGLIQKAHDPLRVGRLLEIKCPVKREINGKIPFEYWCQMQIQMEVADIDECDYIEVKLVSTYKDNSVYVETETDYKGSIWLFQAHDTCELKYAYTEEERVALQYLEWNCIETIPWHMETHYTVTVARDRAWFISTLEKRNELWKTVEEARLGSISLPPTNRSKSKVLVNVCKIMDD